MRSRQAARSIVAVTLTGAITVFGASGADATAPSDGPLNDQPVQVDPADPAVVPTLLTDVLDLAGNLVGGLVPAPPADAPPPTLPPPHGVTSTDLPSRSVTPAPVGASALLAQPGPVPPFPVDCAEQPLGPTAGGTGRSLPPAGGPIPPGPGNGASQAPSPQLPTSTGLTSAVSPPDPCAATTAPRTQQLPQQQQFPSQLPPQFPRQQLPQQQQLPQRTQPPAPDDRDDDSRTGDDDSNRSDRSDDQSDEPSDDDSDDE